MAKGKKKNKKIKTNSKPCEKFTDKEETRQTFPPRLDLDGVTVVGWNNYF